MTQAPLSDAVRRFLTDGVGSVERLTLLLFLHRHPTRWWAAQALAAELAMPADTVQVHLEHLSARNLLDVRIAEAVIYCYKPGREDLAGLVEETARAHYLHRDAVTAVLAQRRAGSARRFADAFQIRKGKRDG
ncbi:MAG: hypothetical protein ACJ76N_13700 [Thermoanaerobaculia bacterium]